MLLTDSPPISQPVCSERRVASSITSGLSLPILLVIAFAARVPAILWSRGYTFFDEQFQYLDPAYHLVTGAPFLQTHEWVNGIRSWVFPGIVAGFLEVARFCGFEGPESELIFVRLCLAVISLLAVYGIWELVRAAKLETHRTAVLILATCNGILVYQGVHPNGPAFSCGLVIFALGLFAFPGRLRALLAGLAVGLAFCCRPQDGLFGASIFVAGVLTKRTADAIVFAAGCTVMILVQGWVDLVTWGSFLHSPIEYVRFNLAHSSNWGGQSIFTYLVVVLIFAPFAHTGLRYLAIGSKRLPWVAFAAAIALVAHQILDRKSPRFVTPSLALVILLWSIGVARAHVQDMTKRGVARFFVTTSWILAAILHAGLFFAASISYASRQRIQTALHLGTIPDATGIAYCGLSPIDSGGAFYYRGTAPRHYVDESELVAMLDVGTEISHVVMRAKTSLELPPPWQLATDAEFDAVWNPSGRQTYVIYRLRRAE
ncbi:MAG: hypothetical protein KDC95_11740 [Planctomycetes bacterium]|nr:hypothetical protein [Planctomycetota bacterium]